MLRLNEKQQNQTLDDLINKCPVFNNYTYSFHNVEIKKGPAYTLCEIDDCYVFKDYILIGENKCRDSYGCHKSKDKQIKRMKRYENFIKRFLGLSLDLPVFYFYAHFENDIPHIEFEGRGYKC